MEHNKEGLAPASPSAQYFNSSALSISIIAVLESEVPINDENAMSLLKDVFLPINPRFSSIMVLSFSLSLDVIYFVFQFVHVSKKKIPTICADLPTYKVAVSFSSFMKFKKIWFQAEREFREANGILLSYFLVFTRQKRGLFLFFSLLSVLVNVGHVCHKWLNLI